MHGDPLLHPSALDSLRGQLFPLATLVTPNLDEVRLLVDIDVVDRHLTSVRRPGLYTHSARSGRWSRAGTCARRRTAPICSSTAPTSTSSTRTRIDTGNDHGAGDTLAAAVASALAHGYTVPDAVAFGKSWVTECLRAAYPLGHGHGPVSALFRLELMNLDQIAGIAHEPTGKAKGAPTAQSC